MTLTAAFIINKFNDFNKMFFNSELPAIKIKVSHARNTFGSFYYSTNRLTGKKTPLHIAISDYYVQDAKGYCETLIHEMIHYYICYKGLAKYEPTHGITFCKLAEKITNSSEYVITVTGSSEGLVSKSALRGKEHMIVIFEYNGNKYFSKVAGQLKQPGKIEKLFHGVKFIKFVTTKAQAAEELPARTSKLSVIPLNKENCERYGIAA